MISDRTKRLLGMVSDKINALDYKLKHDFGVPLTIAQNWHRGQPYPTSELDAFQVMRTLKSEWDEKLGLYETLVNYGAEFATSELAYAMGVSVGE